MSQATELLNRLAEGDATMYTASPETEEHIVINADRTIDVPTALRRIAVQHDHNVETVTFDCPRYWDEHDLSEMVIYIIYAVPGSTKPIAYIAMDKYVDVEDPSVMHFSWRIRRDMTHTAGNISFLVCIKSTDTNGKETNRWSSEINNDLYISPGMELTDSEDTDDVNDMATWLLQYMDHISSAYDVAVANGFEGTEQEWLLSLKGPQGDMGPQGVQGPKGDPGRILNHYIDGETGKWVYELYSSVEDRVITVKSSTSATGPQGPKGDKGDPGTSVTIYGYYDSYSSLVAAHPTGQPGEGYLIGFGLYIWFDELKDWYNIGNIKGPQGDKGEQGPQGETGVGITAIIQGTTSTEDGGENVFEVVTSDGKISMFTVKNGTKGIPGKSAYEYAQDAGYSGTEQEFAEKLANSGTSSGGGSGDTGSGSTQVPQSPQIVIGSEEPTTQCLWFDTSRDNNTTEAAILRLTPDTESGTSVSVEGETYGVENATVGQEPTQTKYNFDII